MAQIDNEPEHVNDPGCWCNPIMFYEGDEDTGQVWLHKSYTGEYPPDTVIVRALMVAFGYTECDDEI